jgi:hypothetical protein
MTLFVAGKTARLLRHNAALILGELKNTKILDTLYTFMVLTTQFQKLVLSVSSGKTNGTQPINTELT